jgi:hypothetical protein
MMNQLKALMILLALYILAAVAYILLPGGMAASAASLGMAAPTQSPTLLAAANAGLILVVYGGLGLLGLWLARKLGLCPAFIGPRPARAGGSFDL